MNLFVFGLSDAQDANWPQFRGPNCSGLAQEGQSPPFEFGPTQNVLWKTAVPAGHSSPCIWGDQIFLSGFDEDKQEISVFCINRSDGSLEWRQIVPTDTLAHLVWSVTIWPVINNGPFRFRFPKPDMVWPLHQ
jgi:hypothetical protein